MMTCPPSFSKASPFHNIQRKNRKKTRRHNTTSYQQSSLSELSRFMQIRIIPYNTTKILKFLDTRYLPIQRSPSVHPKYFFQQDFGERWMNSIILQVFLESQANPSSIRIICLEFTVSGISDCNSGKSKGQRLDLKKAQSTISRTWILEINEMPAPARPCRGACAGRFHQLFYHGT